MSTDERDLLFGRLTRQTREAQRSVGSLEAAISAACRELENLVAALRGTLAAGLAPVAPFAGAVSGIEEMPKPEALLGLVKELEAERRRLTLLKSELERMDEKP